MFKITSKIKAITIFSVCIIFITGTLFFSQTISEGIKNGLDISFYVVIPSMYIFMILANIISSSRLSYYLALPFSFIGKILFRLDTSLFSVFIISLLGGYPVASKIISDKVTSHKISIETAQYMINFCVNSSPSFLIASVSIPMFHSYTYGIIIYCSQIFACMIIALFTGRKKSIQTQTFTELDKPNLSSLFVNSVNLASQSMAIICSFIVLFCGIFVFIDLVPLPDQLKIYIKGLLEVTSGCQLINPSNLFSSVIQVCIFTSFGGVCVILQIMALIKGSNIKMLPFIKIRILYTALSTLITYISLKILNPTINCTNSFSDRIDPKLYSVSPISSVLFISLGLMLLFLLVSNNICDTKKQ